MLQFLRTYYYFFLLVLLGIVLLCVLRSRQKRRREERENTRRRKRDEALSEALRNPLVKREQAPSHGPLEVRWEDQTVRETTPAANAPVAEITELSEYSRRKYVFDLDRPVRIGSGAENELVLSREGVAHYHCEIFLIGARAGIKTVQDSETLLVRKKQCAIIGTEGLYLNDGDHIRLGTAELEFRLYPEKQKKRGR